MRLYPLLSYLIVIFLFTIVITAIRAVVLLGNRWIRHRNIVKAGWPPSHLDGDGDPIKTQKDDPILWKTIETITSND